MRTFNAYVVAATAFVLLNDYSISNERLESYVNRVRQLSKGKYYISAFDSTLLHHQFSFIFQSDETRKYTQVIPELRRAKIVYGYFMRNLPNDFKRILKRAANDCPMVEDLAKENTLKKRRKKKKGRK